MNTKKVTDKVERKKLKRAARKKAPAIGKRPAGEGHVEYLMMYGADGSATFVGLERIVGNLAGKSGSFVLQRTGRFENGMAKESYVVIPGSGTGELRGLRGEGTSAVGHGTQHPFALSYELD